MAQPQSNDSKVEESSHTPPTLRNGGDGVGTKAPAMIIDLANAHHLHAEIMWFNRMVNWVRERSHMCVK